MRLGPKVMHIRQPRDPASLKPGELHLQVTDASQTPEHLRGHACTRVIRDPEGKVISISHPDMSEMGNVTVDDLYAERGEIDTPEQQSKRGLRLGVWILMGMTAVSAVVVFEFLKQIVLHLHWN